MTRGEDIYDVIIAGAGPAGSSAAIHLAQGGLSVLLVEQKGFPRAKLCGEFISPECQPHFKKLGVTKEMMESKPAFITETVFYSLQGHHVTVPSSWFGGTAGLGLSRAVMDEHLLRRAQQLGVNVLENAIVTDLIEEKRRVRGVRIKTDVGEQECRAPVTIDATGRARSITRKVRQRRYEGQKAKPKLIAFKVHLENTRVSPGACEIYVYPRGYGGLSTVEKSISNLCFITTAEDVRRCHSKPEVVLRKVVMKNRRAAHVLEGAKIISNWLSVSLDDFGLQGPSPAAGLLAIGDSAAFIDPFTGSGMLMALESGELVSRIIVRQQDKSRKISSFKTLEVEYAQAYLRRFHSRLRICGLLRYAAFRPRLAELTIAVCGTSQRLRSRIARATRSPSADNHGLTNPG